VCQQALVQRMGPIFEPTFLDSSYGYRPGRSPHAAMRKVWQELNRDRGRPRDPSPPTPPDIRVTAPAVRWFQSATEDTMEAR
jgi:hypothetical protein